MKRRFPKFVALFLTVVMLLPVLQMAAEPVLAEVTSGSFGSLDVELITNLIAPSDEAMFNSENNGGIRFATNINLEKYAALKSFCKRKMVKGLSIGTLIAPLDYVIEAGAFSTEALDTLNKETPYLDIKANTELFYEGEKVLAPGYDQQFVASLINIKLENRERDFAAIGYIQLTLPNNTNFTIYSYDNANLELIQKYAANMAEVATRALAEGGWSDEEYAMIADLAAPAEKLSIQTSTVQDVRIKRNQVYFTYINKNTKFYNRITYNGANGWRLQTNTHSYNHFKDIGAGQSLALYMSEGFHDVASPLTVTQADDKLVIGAVGTDAYAELSYNTFSLDFCHADGASLYNVNGMYVTSGDIKITGKMNATDAVYGGGESFDSTNKRGKTMELYISDAYDANGTYVAIPLFSTSRGGGMFVNRYEPMSLSFPHKDTVGNWSLTIDAEVVDCYFYATGNISDVLQAYVDMTGHASLPAEWAQGYLVCRFQPDFTSIDGITGEGDGVMWYYNITDIPNYNRYTHTPHLLLTEDVLSTLPNGTTINSKDGKTLYYTIAREGANEDKNQNGIRGEICFKTINQTEVKYYNYAELPNKEECYYDKQVKVNLTADSELPHKKAISFGTNYFHYIIENEDEDFNYNGITGESYFLSVTSKSGPAGAGVAYIVESLIASGMTPTAVILEGVTWYNIDKDAAQWATLKKFVSYLDSMNIKTMVYTYLGHLNTTGMSDTFKSEYMLSVNIYEYNTATGEIGKRKTTTTAIPKTDQTDNPDTTSGDTQNYLDITNPEAVKWYMDTVWGVMMDLGIDGLKFDFCESLPNEGYYTNMKYGGDGYLKYNWYDPSVFDGNEVHHAYPSYLISAFYKRMDEKAAEREGDTGFVILTRGGGIGLQRNPYMLAGDQTRRFRNLAAQITAVLCSGISGMSFVTYDMAGYAYFGTSYHYYGGQQQTIADGDYALSLPDIQAAEEYESEIFVRALQFTVFGNTIKTHGDVRHIYQMTDEAQELAVLYTALHDELSGYLRTLSQIACDTGIPMIRHMILQYQNDANVTDLSDQFMYGDALLVAPILTFNVVKDELNRTLLDYASVVTRTVYIPAGDWIDLNTGEAFHSDGETRTVSADLATIPLYLNTASAYAQELQEIFAGETWQAIRAYSNEMQ